MFKAWNKMHDPKTDSIIKPWNYAIGFAPRSTDAASSLALTNLNISAYNPIPISPCLFGGGNYGTGGNPPITLTQTNATTNAI